MNITTFGYKTCTGAGDCHYNSLKQSQTTSHSVVQTVDMTSQSLDSHATRLHHDQTIKTHAERYTAYSPCTSYNRCTLHTRANCILPYRLWCGECIGFVHFIYPITVSTFLPTGSEIRTCRRPNLT